MKRILFVLALAVISSAGFGQKKPKINAAEKALVDGNLAEAKEIIDQASEFEKIKDDGKTWYYRGLIYAALDTTQNAEYQNLAQDPLQEAMRSFAKSDELNSGKNEYYTTDQLGLPITKSQQISTLWAYYLNQGVENYQAQNLEEAVNYFEKTTVVQPEDTTGYIYAASAAQIMEDYDRAAKHYYTLINDLDYHSEDVYNALLYIETQINKDDEKGLEIARQAKEQFPNNTGFAKTEINILIKSGKSDEALANLEKALAAEPNNPDLWFSLGVMYEETGNSAEARKAYEKSVEADPNYYNGNYNLAVIRYNEAVDLIKERNNLGISAADQKKAKEMGDQINAKLQEALPQWEKVNELVPNDTQTLETLQYIYLQLKMNDKAEAVADQLDKLGG